VEAGVARGVRDDQLAVENDTLERNRLDRARDFRKRLGVVEPFARIQNRLAILARRAHAIAVELHFKQPPVSREWTFARLGEHQLGIFGAQRAFRCAQLLELLLYRLSARLAVLARVV